MLKRGFLFSIVLIGTLISGCASTSVFNPYPNQAANYKAAITTGTIDGATADLASKRSSEDKILYMSESGRLHQLNNQFQASKEDFAIVINAYNAYDEKATVSMSKLAAGAGSMLTNDNSIPYSGFGYERIFVHQFQAFNYLGLGDLEGAGVEIRLAAQQQRIQELAHDKEVSAAESDARKNQVDLNELNNRPELSGMDSLIGTVKSSFQNAYTFYTSAVIWEAQGEANDALVDYKKALEINPNNLQIQEDITRLTNETKITGNNGVLVVLFEDGFVPARMSFNLALPYFSGNSFTYLNIAFPFYSTNLWYYPQTVHVYNNGQSLGRTAEIANVSSMAVKALKEKMPSMVMRQFVRAVAKNEAHKVAAEKGGIIGSLVSTVYNIVSEQADLRNWLTLPSNAQILRKEIPSGVQNIELDMGGTSQTEHIKINKGRITILRVINANNRLITQTFNL